MKLKDLTQMMDIYNEIMEERSREGCGEQDERSDERSDAPEQPVDDLPEAGSPS